MKPTAEALFERYHARIYRYFRQVAGRHEDAQDLAQELFLRLVRGWDRYQASGRETGWVFRAARNLALDYRRRRRTVADIGGEDLLAGMRPGDAPQVLAFGLSEALGLLSEGDRDLVLLREVAGLTYRELSEVCEATPAAVSQRLYRIRQRLRGLLGSKIDAGTCRSNR